MVTRAVRELPPIRWGALIARLALANVTVGIFGYCVLRAGGRSAGDALTGVVVGVVGLSVVTAVLIRTRQDDWRAAAAPGLTAAQLAEGERAARTGPAPSDPQVRHEAIRLILERRARDGPARPLSLVCSIVALGCAGAAVLMSPWWWGVAGIAVLAAVALLLTDGHQRRRLAVLRSEPPTTGP